MFKNLFTLCFFLSLIACNLEEDIPNIENENIGAFYKDSLTTCFTTSDKISFNYPSNTTAPKIESITKYQSIDNEISITMDSFYYTENTDYVVAYKSTNDNRFHFEKYSYEDNLLTSISTFNSKDNINSYPPKIDSLIYNKNSQLIGIKEYYHQSGNSYKLLYETKYYYANNLPVLKKKESTQYADFVSLTRYCWDNGNLVKSRHYSSSGDLNYEQTFAYDNHQNYKNLMPTEYSNPQSWSTNNLKTISTRDALGMANLQCGNPCEHEIIYSQHNDYPKAVNAGENAIYYEITYK